MNRRKFLGTTATAGLALIAKPYLARAAKHELLVAEIVHRGVFDDASPAEVAALASCLIEEARSAEDQPSRQLLRERPRLRRRVRQTRFAAPAALR